MIERIYRWLGMQFETADITPLKTLGGITNASVTDNPNLIIEYTDGALDVQKISKRGSEEIMSATTLNVDDAIDIVGSRFICQKGPNANAGVKLFAQVVNQCDTAPGTENVEYQIPNHPTNADTVTSIINAVTLNVEHGQSANMTIAATPRGFANNAGITTDLNASLPTNIIDNKHRYGLSKLVVGGVELEGKKSLNCAFNVRVSREGADGEIYPSFVYADQIGTIITVRGIDPRWLDATKIPRAGRAFAHVDSQFYLARYKDDGTDGYEDSTNPVHIAGSMNGVAFITQMASGQGRQALETVLAIYLDHDGTNVPLTLNTNQVIL